MAVRESGWELRETRIGWVQMVWVEGSGEICISLLEIVRYSLVLV